MPIWKTLLPIVPTTTTTTYHTIAAYTYYDAQYIVQATSYLPALLLTTMIYDRIEEPTKFWREGVIFKYPHIRIYIYIYIYIKHTFREK